MQEETAGEAVGLSRMSDADAQTVDPLAAKAGLHTG
jgi:hypothetical protein